MCYNIVFAIAVSIFINAEIKAESSEDPTSFTYYAPATLNFHDIYANNLALLADDSSTISNLLDDDVLKNLPAQFVEFQPQTATNPPVATQTNGTNNKNGTETMTTTTASTTTSISTSTTEEPTVKVLPIDKGNKYQRGVLDLLFPATRVKNFKSVFDTIRRLLSHTF